MAHGQAGHVLRQVRRLVQTPPAGEVPDRQLLDRFATTHDDAAFAALVARHGPLVRRVCRRILQDTDRADDAFQATFLVLARKAATAGRQGSLACFLYGVASRIALHLRSDVARRRRREAGAAVPPAADPIREATRHELAAVLDEELARLPERLRAPLVLCCLDGQSRDEAARRLGWSLGTLKRRLERGRALLRRRLERRGWAFGVILAHASLAPPNGPAVPAALVEATTRAVRSFLAGAPTRAADLAGLVLRGLVLRRLRTAAVLLVLTGLALTGAGVLAYRAAAEPEGPLPAEEPRAADAARPAPPTDRFGDPLPAGALARLGTVRFRHGNRINSVAFSPDGTMVLSAGEDRRVCFWDAATGRLLRQWADYRGGLGCAFFSPDGKLVITGSWDDPKQYVTAVRVRDRATGRQLHEFTVDGRFWDGSVAISPDGTTLAGSGGFNRLRLWDVATGKQRELTCQGVEDYTENVAFSPDSRLLASAGGKRIRLWDVATGERVGDLDSQGPVRSLAYSPDGKLLAATCGGHIRLLHAPTGKEAATLGGPEPKYWSVAFAPDGKTLLSGATNGEAALWDVATGKEVREFPGKDSMRVWSVAFAPDGRTVAVGHEGSMVRVWETATGKEVVAPEGHVNWPGFLSFTRDGKEVLTAAWDRTVRFWDPATGRETRRLKTDDAYWMEGALAPDGRTAAATGDKAVPLIDLATGKEVRRFPGHRYYSRNLVFTPDGKELITTGHMESDVRFWDAGTGKLLRRLRTPHVNQPWSLAISPDGRTMATGGEFDDALCLWDVAGGRKLREWHGHGKGQDPRERGIGVLAFSPDGKLLASSGPDDTIRLWEVPTARPQGVLHGAGQVAFSPDGRTLAASADGNAIRLWEVATGLERHRFVGHRGFVVRLAFSPDGRAMASASLDTTVLVWDVRGGGRHATLSPRELDAAWDRLAGADAAAAYDAVCALAAAPGSAVAFLRERIKPDAAPAPATLARLVKDLDSDRFEDRQKAAQELERLEELARPALREALAGKPSPELHRRVEQLLDRLDGLAPPPRRLRRLRAIEALEMIGNAASREVLRGVAAGDPDSRVQQEAKNALAR